MWGAGCGLGCGQGAVPSSYCFAAWRLSPVGIGCPRAGVAVTFEATPLSAVVSYYAPRHRARLKNARGWECRGVLWCLEGGTGSKTPAWVPGLGLEQFLLHYAEISEVGKPPGRRRGVKQLMHNINDDLIPAPLIITTSFALVHHDVLHKAAIS